MGWLIIIGTIPIVVVGFLLPGPRSAPTFRSLWIVAIVLIVFGILLGLADWLGRKTEAQVDHLTYRDGILIGLAQMLALIPGVSRSGASTRRGLALGYDRPAAARFSFLLAVPAVFGSGLYERTRRHLRLRRRTADCGMRLRTARDAGRDRGRLRRRASRSSRS